MSIIFSSVFFGSYILWNRKFDFLKSVMVTPVSRDTIFVGVVITQILQHVGKTLGGMINSLLRVAIFLVSDVTIAKMYLNAFSLAQTILVVLLLSFSLTSLGLI